MQRPDDLDETPQATSDRPAKRLSALRIVLLITFGLTFFGIAGYFFLSRLAEIEQQMARLNKQVEETVQKAADAAERSDAALSRASQAEENALQAARGRIQAEQAEAAAQTEAELARQEAAVAAQESERAREETRLAQEETERIRKQREEEMARLQKALGQIAETRRTALGLVMNLGSDSIQFDFDKANLRPEHRELLSRIVGVLLTSNGYRVQVFGHTDDVGSEQYNLELSGRRARAVRDYLIEAGIAPDILTAKGFGKSSPLAPGTDPQARTKNRRVEIGIIDSVIGYQGSVARREE